jgi:hypothetical protein
METLKNPTSKAFAAFIARCKHREVRGIIDQNDGAVFICDATTGLHAVMARNVGVEFFTGFMVRAPYDEDEETYDYYLDFPAVWGQVPFLEKFRVNVAGMAITQPKVKEKMAA